MKLFACILALCTALLAHAATRQEQLDAQFQLNQASPNAMAQNSLGDKLIAETHHSFRAYWDFSVQGGAATALTLRDASTNQPAKLPKGAIIRNCVLDVVTAPSPVPTVSASPNPTIAVSIQSAGDLKAAAVSSGFSALMACVPVGSAATAIKLTADRTMTLTIASGALAAGKIYVVVDYDLSNTL